MKKVAVVGTGFIFQKEHVLGYIATNQGYIVGFHDVSESVAQTAINLYKEGMQKRALKANTAGERELCEKALRSKFYSDFDQLLNDVDAVDICTPPQFHMYYAQKAAQKGKAVLCEKPLARSYLDAKDTLENLKKIPLYIFTQVIYNPIFKKGKEIIDSGKIGEIIKMRCCHATLDLSHTVEKAAFWNPLISGGGALKDIGPHAFSVMRYWLGEDYKLKSVKDEGIQTIVTERTIEGKPNTKVIVDDCAKVGVEWEKAGGNIVSGQLEAYWLEKKSLPNELKLAGLYHEVEGTKGKLIFPKVNLGFIISAILGKMKLTIIYNDGKVENITIPAPKPHQETLIAIDEFLSGVSSRSPAWYGEDMMIVLDAAYLSKKEGGKKITMTEFQNYISSVPNGEILIKDLFKL
jgi:predicted dehydrogenase